MPPIKVERIVSFTSEDTVYTANNILSKDTSKKWKCKDAGEKNAIIVLQLDQPYVISGIDIGNEHSAYIEVLVSRSSSPEDYKVLLVMSSFMTPLEARQSQNVNKVRMFKPEDFSDPEKNEKWDRVKIVCTQPFNRHVQYGLSFINLYTSNGKPEGNSKQGLIGKFTIRPESPDNISTGSLFARRKELQETTSEQTLKGAAAIREATSLAHSGSPTVVKHKIKQNLPTTPNTQSSNMTDNSLKPRNRNELLYSKDEEDAHDKIDKIIEKKTQEKKEEKNRPEKQEKKRVDHEKEKQKKLDKTIRTGGDLITNRTDTRETKVQKDSNKRKHSDQYEHKLKKQKKSVVRKPFSRLLEDVILVISGIQNPDRASLRSMALSMGAKYKPDWENTCTHLVCAFANTPKFNQVKGKGKIVKRSWIESCYNERKRIPWRKYALDKADKGIESEEEILCEEDADHEENSNMESDVDMESKEEGSDTEDKIKQIEKKKKETLITDKFQTDTDNETLCDDNYGDLKIKRTLKTFFDDKMFFVDEVFDADLMKKIKQYIVAYKGILVENLVSAVDIVITNRLNTKVFKETYSSAIFLPPDWIWECHNRQEAVSMKDYIFE